MKSFNVPKEVLKATETLQKRGFAAYLVGGCVRDLVMGKKPKDWDITTDAKPDEIIDSFSETFYENDFGTVGVVNEKAPDESVRVIEITPYRIEEKYADKRRPDKVVFAGKLEDDLRRRDFTINSMAYDPESAELVDPHKGQKDIKDKIIRAVGTPSGRLEEDALRIMRAVRIGTELGFKIEEETGAALKKLAGNLSHIAIERIRDEFSRILMSQNPKHGLELLQKYSILAHIVPELTEGLGMEQNGDHIYDVWEHTTRAAQHSADRNWPLHVRLSALFHDVGKPRTRRWSKEKNDWTFYGHDVVGARMAKDLLKRLRYPADVVERVTKLVRWHLFFSDIDKITLSAVRRLVRNVGPENVWDLMKVRACDRIGMGRPKEKPYRLRKYESMIEEAVRAPVSVGMLAIKGERVMELTGEKPGPRIGWILHALLEDVLDDPDKNAPDVLEKRAAELSALSDEKLCAVGEKGKQKRLEEEERELAEIRKRYGVQ